MFCSQKTHTHYVIFKISYLFSNTIHKYYEPTKTMEKSRTRGPLISSPKFQNLDFKSSICKIANPSKQSKSRPSLEFYNEFEREREMTKPRARIWSMTPTTHQNQSIYLGLAIAARKYYSNLKCSITEEIGLTSKKARHQCHKILVQLRSKNQVEGPVENKNVEI